MDLVESRAFELIDEAALETAIEGADFKKLVKAMSPRGARSAACPAPVAYSQPELSQEQTKPLRQ